MISDKTKKAYRQLAAYHYQTFCGGSESVEIVARILEDRASDTRPDYWRRLRNALTFDLEEKGRYDEAQQIKELMNPVTFNEKPVKPKQKRVKRIIEADLNLIFDKLAEGNDYELKAALILALKLGCRPSEMLSLTFLPDCQIKIIGSKKTESRGLDRVIKLRRLDDYELLRSCVAYLHKSELAKAGVISRAQRRLAYLTSVLWPKKKHRITLYSFRHQKGADLKRGGYSRLKIAYLMGHQSTDSVSRYGDRRTGSGEGVQIDTEKSESELEECVREKHSSPPRKNSPSYSGPKF